jgi:hypothetical protein
MFLRSHGVGELPWLNRGSRLDLELTPEQKRRIERIYAGDFALIDSLSQDRAARKKSGATPSHALRLRTATSS